ncbi:MAG: tetratricopeptide repeat protein [Chloracidobacterium sp.]|nr:tetratricopeptide repeat protein [Chloracidobacterium sp.]
MANSSAQGQTPIEKPAARVTEALAGALRQAADILSIEDPTARDAALRKLIEIGDASEQIQAAQEAAVTGLARKAESALAQNDVEGGMENFRRAVAKAPERVDDRFFEETLIRIPFALSARGYRNEAVEMARDIEGRFAKAPARLAALGEFYMTIEAAGDAIRALEAASKLAGDDASLDRSLGAAYRMGLRLDDAIAKYRRAAILDANDKRAFYELANLYRAKGDYAGAIELYRKQLEIVPNHSPSYKGLALAYLAQGDQERMAAALDQARSSSGANGGMDEVAGDVYLQTQLAFLYLAKNKLKEAQQAAAAALLVEPRYSWARIAASEVDLANGNYFDAERDLIAARSYASFPTLYFMLGKLYMAVEDFDGALEQFSKSFDYSPDGRFRARLGGVYDARADNLKELLAPEHQAAIFLANSPTKDETFKIAEGLVRFDAGLRAVTTAMNSSSKGEAGDGLKGAAENANAQRQQIKVMERAAMDFIEAESSRRSFRMLNVAERLAHAGVSTGLAVELAEQALGLAQAATEPEGSLRDYPNYDRAGRLAIFRGRALSAKGWALYKAGKNSEAAAALTGATQAYGALPEGRHAIRRLATVKETQGELKEALDLYIAGYEAPASDSGSDVSRVVIEALYRKINGSLEGLDKLLQTTRDGYR